MYDADVYNLQSLPSAVVVGCMAPFKSIFRSYDSFRRHRSPTSDRDLPPGCSRLVDIRLGGVETGCCVEAQWKSLSRPVDGDSW